MASGELNWAMSDVRMLNFGNLIVNSLLFPHLPSITIGDLESHLPCFFCFSTQSLQKPYILPRPAVHEDNKASSNLLTSHAEGQEKSHRTSN